jgi:Ca2+-binding RTX toxin-like protein
MTPDQTKFVGSDCNEVIYGTPGDDWIFGGGGNDAIFGLEGHDHLLVIGLTHRL